VETAKSTLGVLATGRKVRGQGRSGKDSRSIMGKMRSGNYPRISSRH